MLAFEEHGKGFPLILIHAFPLSRKMWASQVESLQSNYRIILPDMPGFGESKRIQEPSLAAMAGMIAELLDGLKISDKVFLGGLSMGGYIALEFARQFPERLKGLGLFATRSQADSPEAKENRAQAIAVLKKDGVEPFAVKTAGNLIGRTTAASHPGVIEKVTTLIRANRAEGISDALMALANRRDSSGILSLIQCPALILTGDEDGVIPVDDARLMKQKIANAEIQFLPEVGHLINLESPGAFNSLLNSFLSKL